MNDESKISQRYRELPRDEPSRHVDEAILAAARRAAQTRPAPLVVPSGRQRWYFPLAAAAIIVLAVAVTVHIERQNRDVELAEAPVASPPAAREEQTAPAQAPAEPQRRLTPDPKSAPSQEQRDAAPLADLQKAQKLPSSPTPAPPPAAAPATPPPESGIRESVQPDAGARAKVLADTQQAPAPAPPPAAARAPAPAAKPWPQAEQRAMDVAGRVRAATGSFAHASPEQWLQGIADLRRQGRHDEADKALAEFRKRYPDYKIPEAMLETFEKRAK